MRSISERKIIKCILFVILKKEHLFRWWIEVWRVTKNVKKKPQHILHYRIMPSVDLPLDWLDMIAPANISHLMLNWSTFQATHSPVVVVTDVYRPKKKQEAQHYNSMVMLSKANFICSNWHNFLFFFGCCWCCSEIEALVFPYRKLNQKP